MSLLKRYLPILSIAILAYACSKGTDEPIASGPTGRINMINAVTDIRAINFYLNGTRQNVNSAIFINSASNYITVPAAEQQYQIKEDTTRQQIASIAVKLPKDGVDYSLLVTGQKAAGNISAILMDDSYTDTTPNTAKIRFVQGVAGTGSYDVYVGDNVSFKNQAFKSVTNFTNLTPGTKVLKITQAGSTSAIYTQSVTLTVGTYYTLYSKGAVNGTGANALSLILLATK